MNHSQSPADITEVNKILSKRYRNFAHHNKKNPLNELLFILCSTRTRLSNYTRTYYDLRVIFPTIKDLSVASEQEIADALSHGGLHRQKAKMIREILRAIKKSFGRVTLAPLFRMTDDEAYNYLTSLPGVGKKVAKCILLYSLGRAVFPVDTHCARIAVRLGWIPELDNHKEAKARHFEALETIIPDCFRFSLHVNLISFGRKICTAISPRCGRCPLQHLCPRTGINYNMATQQ